MNILMVAAENANLPKCKAGGLGDVVRDVPFALAEQGHRTASIVPLYYPAIEMQSKGEAEYRGHVTYAFGGMEDSAEIWRVGGERASDGVVEYVVKHPGFLSFNTQRGEYQLYEHSLYPFEFDATKYARFCTAVAASIVAGVLGEEFSPGRLDCLHLHDWHAGFLFILRRFDKAYRSLQGIHTAFTIHNLALKGLRPFSGTPSSMAEWYPHLKLTHAQADEIRDWEHWNCVNPMACGVRMADAVHVVSPTYAQEVQRPCRHDDFCGGENLEWDLKNAAQNKRLFGILNGLDYPADHLAPKRTFGELIALLKQELSKWTEKGASNGADTLAMERLEAFERRCTEGWAPEMLLTSVGRVGWQKTQRFGVRCTNPRTDGAVDTALDHVLSYRDDVVLILLGNGEEKYERVLNEVAARHPNFLFLNGFSNAAAGALYASGDLFLMPSTYEPCGLSQMLAMRDGQPALVHKVGGLADTVQHGVNGFSFGGDTEREQAKQFVGVCFDAIDLKLNNREAYDAIKANAAAARFLWKDTAGQYVELLYRRPPHGRPGRPGSPGRAVRRSRK